MRAGIEPWTSVPMTGWPEPQMNVQTTLKSPILLGVARSLLVWPGVALICTRHAGTQKPWMTSFDSTSKSIFVFTGTTSWWTFVRPSSG